MFATTNKGIILKLPTLIILAIALAACSSAATQSPPSITAAARQNTATQSPSVTPSPAPTISPTPPPTSSPTRHPTVTSTPTPFGPPAHQIIPDSEIVYSPSAIDFDVLEYIDLAGGFLSTYRQYLMITAWTTGADIITRVALENSINPRILLALLEYQSGCVLGQPDNPDEFSTAMGAEHHIRQDLYGQLTWAVHELSEGYYGWRSGTLTEITLLDGSTAPLAPDLNAGSVALQYLFAQLYDGERWEEALDPERGFPALYMQMFGDPWERAASVEPLIPSDSTQPPLSLPFGPGKAWAYTGGPHQVFESSGPLAALDFAPPASVSGCYTSDDWVTAMAGGLVVRSELGVVIQDLDGDGHEQTGWVLMYLHIEERDRVPLGTYLHADEQVGHPSCEGGRSTGNHVHIARKYNGEWMSADGAIPFVLSGWAAHAGEKPYLGTLTRGDDIVTAHQYGSFISRISRDEP
ncbi:MAG: hypothetical protein KKD28_12185 [Chloroflexi bacterium]|nr:hypothetical protein [Chloroflexota bacterium]MBU1662217.1 hypothetical protein [Chloroflexota bacterium]